MEENAFPVLSTKNLVSLRESPANPLKNKIINHTNNNNNTSIS